MREQDIRHVPSNAWGALVTKLVELSRSLLGRHLARVTSARRLADSIARFDTRLTQQCCDLMEA
jgi:hypothetical protein